MYPDVTVKLFNLLSVRVPRPLDLLVQRAAFIKLAMNESFALSSVAVSGLV
jgi:hypothetical protein